MSGDLRVRCALVLFRHGARTPCRDPAQLPTIKHPAYALELLDTLPGTDLAYHVTTLDGQSPRPASEKENGYRKVTLDGGCPLGQLTVIGQRQALDLGKSLQHSYIKDLSLLPVDVHVGLQKHVYVRSVNIQRCLDTARCVLAGLLGSNSQDYSTHAQRSGNTFKIHVVGDSDEILYPNHDLYKTMKNRSYEYHKYIKGLEEFRIKLQDLIAHDEYSDTAGPLNLMDLADNISCRQAHGFSLPGEIETVLPQLMDYGVKILEGEVLGSPSLPDDQELAARRHAHPMMTLIRDILAGMLTDGLQNKLCLLSGQDRTLLPILNCLKMYDGKWPKYCADLRFEIWEEEFSKLHWVKTTYNGSVSKMFRWDQFEILIGDLTRGCR